MTFAARERRALADALSESGPNAPTLCEGWQTRQLAAHLVLRQSRLDAPVVLAADALPTLKPYALRTMEQVAARPYDELVHEFRTGPPRVPAFAKAQVDALLNTVEHFVHLEDVRRAQDDWEPRQLRDDDQRTLWAALTTFAAATFLRAPVAAVLRVPGGPRTRVGFGTATVVLTGPVGELTMAVLGRTAHRVELTGPELARDAYLAWRR